MSPHACAQGEEEEHEAHAGQLEVFASVAVIGDETFAGDTEIRWIPTAAGWHDISILVTQVSALCARVFVLRVYV